MLVNEALSVEIPSQAAVLAWGRDVLLKESQALVTAAERLGESFFQAVQLMLACRGKVVLTGLGKSGHIGAKIASTLSSTGTPAIFLHPTEALHGDFGMLASGDLVLALAYGGETREVLAVCRFAQKAGLPVIGMSGFADSYLAKRSDVFLDVSVVAEADSLGLAPTTSSSLSLALGDALAVALMRARGFSREHFARLHPEGRLGRSLVRVQELMRPLSVLSQVSAQDDFHRVLEAVTSPNFGIVPITDPSAKLLGCVSDGDLRRALLQHGGKALELQAKQLMHAQPKTVRPDVRVVDAIALMEEFKITSIFVCGPEAELLGLLRLHDLLSANLV